MPEYQTLSILEDGTGKQVGVILVIDNAIAAIISSYPRHDFGYDGVVGIGVAEAIPHHSVTPTLQSPPTHGR